MGDPAVVIRARGERHWAAVTRERTRRWAGVCTRMRLPAMPAMHMPDRARAEARLGVRQQGCTDSRRL